MKKVLSPISVVLAFLILISTVLPLTASATGDEISLKDTTAYIYNMEKTETLKCVFKSNMPDMALISTVDFLKHVYFDEPTETKNTDGTYMITNPKGTMVIDAQKDTLHFDNFEDFVSAKVNVDGTEMDVPYIKEYAPVNEGEINALDLDLSPYKIDIIEYDGKTYFPVSTIGIIFSGTYNTAVYCNDEVYFVHSSDIAMGNCYFKNSTPYNTLKRSKDLVELTYNDLCFAVDKFYGRPAQAEIASMLEEKSFDETLDEYNDDTRRAKELLLSENMVDYVLGTAYLGEVFFDGGHTAINYPAVLSFTTPGTAIYNELEKLADSEDFRDRAAINYAMNTLASSQKSRAMSEFRSGKYKDYNLVKSWDDKSVSKLYVTGDTAVFAFDSFVNEAVYNFKWSLDYAKEKGIKRFVIDISCNSGGNAAVVMYIMAMITNKNKDSYVASYRKIQTLTGNITRNDNDVDLNLDGQINDLDKSVYYDFEYAFITSKISYSCGNLLPCLAKEAGFPILGERSGGGACSLLIAYTPETFFYTMSSYNKFITKDNKDVDNGAELDYDLTKQASDGNSIDYSGLYNVAAYSKMIDEFYGVKPSETINISKVKISGLKNKTYTGKALKQTLTLTYNGKKLSLNTDYKVSYSNNKNVGTAKVKLTGIGKYTGALTKTFKIFKAKQTMTVRANTKTVKASKLKKTKAIVKKAITVKNNKGYVTYKKVSGSKYITISKKGVITVRKGKYKKQTLKIKVKVTAKGNSNYNSGSKTVTVKIVIK